MVETAAGPDRQRLPEVLAERAAEFDWVCITSPEAAAVFLEGWRAGGRPPVRLAVVGDGTGRVFEAAAADGAPQPAFVPTVVSGREGLAAWLMGMVAGCTASRSAANFPRPCTAEHFWLELPVVLAACTHPPTHRPP